MLKEIFHDSLKISKLTRICMENHSCVTATDCPMTQLSYERYNMYSIRYELFHHPLNGVQIVFIDEE